MSEEIKQKVTDAINTSGYPLELFIGNEIRKQKQPIWYNEYFFDYENNISRTLDLVVPGFNFKKKERVPFGSELIIECKKSSQTAWVFFETNSFVQMGYAGQFFDAEQYATGNYMEENLAYRFDGKLEFHYGKNHTRSPIAQNYQVVRIGEKDLANDQKPPKAKDTIFEAVNQVVKYIVYRMTNGAPRILNRFLEIGIYPVFNLYYPIIVYDGPLYNGFLNQDNIELQEREHIVLQHRFMTPYVDSEQTFYIDIVKKEYFKELLNDLINETTEIGNRLNNLKDKFQDHMKSITIPNKRLREFNLM